MAITITCDECFQDFTVKDEAAGKKVKCKSCGAVVAVPKKGRARDDDDDDDDEAPRPSRSASKRSAAKPRAKSRGGMPVWGWVLIGVSTALLIMCGGPLLFFMYLASRAQQIVSKMEAEAGKPGGARSILEAPATPSVAWSVKADPATEKIEWPANFTATFSVPGSLPHIAFPKRPSRFVITNLGADNSTSGRPTVWDLIKGEKVGDLKSATGDGNDFVFSPDGKYLLVQAVSFKKIPPALWSVETGGTIPLGPEFAETIAADFAGPHQAILWTKAKKLYLVDAQTGKIQQSADTVEGDNDSALTISPGSRHVAIGGKEGKIQVFEIATAKLVGETFYPGSLKHWTLSNLAFSNDGTHLASFINEMDKTHLLVSDLKSGLMEIIFTMPGSIAKMSDSTYSYKGPKLVALEGDRGWLIYGQFVVDQKSKQIVWQFPYHSGDILPTPRQLAGGSVVALAGPTTNRQFKSLEIPWSKIDTALAGFDPKEALFGKGTQVRLDIQVGAVLNGGQPAPTKDMLEKSIRKRLSDLQVEVRDGDESLAVVKVDYSEKAGPNMEFRPIGASLRGAGTSIPTTLGTLQVTLVSENGQRTHFKHAFNAEPPGFLFNAQPSATVLRDKMLEKVKTQIESVPFPVFIPKDPTAMSIPGITPAD